MNLGERLDKHIQNIREDAQDIAKVKSLIDGNDYDAKLQKALLDCCKSGNFRPSAALDNALLNAAIEDAELDDDSDSLRDAIDNLLGTDEWVEGLLVSLIGHDFMTGFKKLNISPEFTKTWEDGVRYCQDQQKKLYNKAISKIK